MSALKGQYSDVDSVAGPARRAFSITGHNTDELAVVTRGVMVTASGNLNLVFEGDTDAVVVPVTQNVYYPFAVKIVKSTSTTATGIIGFY